MTVTIQTSAVKQALTRLGHATNQQLHTQVTKDFANLSVTTVHRITSRLAAAGEIGYAPSDGKVVVLDSNAELHNHFICKGCGGTKDITLEPAVFTDIQKQLGKNIIENELVIYGMCIDCADNNEGE